MNAPDGDGENQLAVLKVDPDNPHLLGGYGPLALGAVLFILMVFLAPTVAPEHLVERPVQSAPVGADSSPTDATTSTTEVAP